MEITLIIPLWVIIPPPMLLILVMVLLILQQPIRVYYFNYSLFTFLVFKKTSKYITLRVFGTGMRDGFIMAFGYLVEMGLLSLMYNLLYNVYLIHNVFNNYCLALSALQNFHCSNKELDEFYTLC